MVSTTNISDSSARRPQKITTKAPERLAPAKAAAKAREADPRLLPKPLSSKWHAARPSEAALKPLPPTRAARTHQMLSGAKKNADAPIAPGTRSSQPRHFRSSYRRRICRAICFASSFRTYLPDSRNACLTIS